jgi:hypothetical protein
MARIEILYSTDRDDMDAITSDHDDAPIPLAVVKLGEIKGNEARMAFAPEAALPEHEGRMREFFDAHADTLPSWGHFTDAMQREIRGYAPLLGDDSCGVVYFHPDKRGEVENNFYCICSGWTLRDVYEKATAYRSPTKS